MENKKIVKLLLKKESNDDNKKDLANMLLKEPVVVDIDKKEKLKTKKGDIIADRLTNIIGSWKFIIIFSLLLISWIVLNLFFIKIDSYPFILLNLLLSCIASLQAPIIMMSQNRMAKQDSLRSLNDYKIDLKTELILEELYKKIDLIIENQNKKDKN